MIMSDSLRAAFWWASEFMAIIALAAVCIFWGASYPHEFGIGDRTVGVYDFRQAIMVECDGRSIADIERTFHHELGHHLYMEHLSAEDVHMWENLSANDGYFVSRYAETDAEEDFCETYGHFRIGICPMEERKCRFVNDMHEEVNEDGK